MRHGPGGDGQLVGAEHDAQRLHPRKVARAALWALADEMRVDVDVGVGDEAKVLVLATVEVEDDAVAAHDLGVAAHATPLLAIGCTVPLFHTQPAIDDAVKT